MIVDPKNKTNQETADNRRRRQALLRHDVLISVNFIYKLYSSQ